MNGLYLTTSFYNILPGCIQHVLAPFLLFLSVFTVAGDEIPLLVKVFASMIKPGWDKNVMIGRLVAF